MFVTSCPACGDAVTVPSRARPTSQMRCPLCSTEFTLEELLSTLPPMLELIGETEESYFAEAHSRHAAVGGREEAGGVATLVAGEAVDDVVIDEEPQDIALAQAEPRATKPSYNFEGGAATAGSGARGSVTATARPKKKGKNALFEIVKVLFGGLAAIPVAIAILWFGFGRDPFEAGPTIAKYVPWVVPAKFQGKSAAPKVEANPAPNTPVPAVPKQPPEDLSQVPDIDNPNPMPAPGGLGPDPDFPTAKDPLDAGAGGVGTTEDLVDPLKAFSDPGMKKKEAAVPAPANNDPAASLDPDSTNSKAEKLTVANAPKYTGPELAEALNTATKAAQAWDEGSPTAEVDALKALKRELYKSLAQLSEKATFADHDDLEVATQVKAIREFLVSLQGKPKVVELISQVGPLWAMSATAEVRGTNGVIMVGTIEEKAADDKTSMHKFLTGNSMQPEVGLVIAPQNAQAGVKSLVLGTIVEEPALAIPGFVGEEKRVVFGDFLVPFPAQ